MYIICAKIDHQKFDILISYWHECTYESIKVKSYYFQCQRVLAYKIIMRMLESEVLARKLIMSFHELSLLRVDDILESASRESIKFFKSDTGPIW